MAYEWDELKARANYRKHHVHFADSVSVFEDDAAITVRDNDSDEEERFVTIGRDAFARLLVVVYTWRGANIRLISARRANRRETKGYET
ncbi:MAG TPA: BrnT family toxin [Thermoanaerobaculia bacterium]|nr:BrnT family toxin [Thermoanaerobaculia bacterium]